MVGGGGGNGGGWGVSLFLPSVGVGICVTSNYAKHTRCLYNVPAVYLKYGCLKSSEVFDIKIIYNNSYGNINLLRITHPKPLVMMPSPWYTSGHYMIAIVTADGRRQHPHTQYALRHLGLVPGPFVRCSDMCNFKSSCRHELDGNARSDAAGGTAE